MNAIVKAFLELDIGVQLIIIVITSILIVRILYRGTGLKRLVKRAHKSIQWGLVGGLISAVISMVIYPLDFSTALQVFVLGFGIGWSLWIIFKRNKAI